MDNPLRPISVPLEAETILWFEFLLNPTLLTTHLRKDGASELNDFFCNFPYKLEL